MELEDGVEAISGDFGIAVRDQVKILRLVRLRDKLINCMMFAQDFRLEQGSEITGVIHSCNRGIKRISGKHGAGFNLAGTRLVYIPDVGEIK